MGIYDTDRLELLKELKDIGSDPKLHFRPDGSGPLVLSPRSEIFDGESGKPIVSEDFGRNARELEFSPDEKSIHSITTRADPPPPPSPSP